MRYSRTFLALAFAWMAVARAVAASPSNIAGMLYFDDTVTSARTNASEACKLNPDGTYRGIFRVQTYGIISTGNPTDGTWTYRKTGPNTAQLTLGSSDTRTLTFDSAEEGTLSGIGSVPRFGTFKLVDPTAKPPLLNCSNRSFVRGGGAAFLGFVVSEKKSHVLIRAIGPGLASFGVSPILAAPLLEIYSGQALVAQNAGWSVGAGQESIRRTGELVGAFPLQSASEDAALIVPLAPGAYTAKVSGADTSNSGESLIEIYIIR